MCVFMLLRTLTLAVVATAITPQELVELVALLAALRAQALHYLHPLHVILTRASLLQASVLSSLLQVVGAKKGGAAAVAETAAQLLRCSISALRGQRAYIGPDHTDIAATLDDIQRTVQVLAAPKEEHRLWDILPSEPGTADVRRKRAFARRVARCAYAEHRRIRVLHKQGERPWLADSQTSTA